VEVTVSRWRTREVGSDLRCSHRTESQRRRKKT
jgi:hypothetical protein